MRIRPAPAPSAFPATEADSRDVSGVAGVPATSEHGEQRRRTLSLRAKGVVVVAVPATALALAMTGLFLVERAAAHRETRTQRLIAVERATGEVLQLLTDAETGVRGYVAVGDPSFLTTEDAARLELPAALARLRSLTAGTAGEADSRRVVELADRELALLAVLEERAERSSEQDAQLTALLRSAKLTMDDLRRTQGRVVARERARVSSSHASYVRAVHRVNLAGVAFTLVGLVGGVGGAGLLMGRIVVRVRRVAANAEALAAGDRLEPAEEVGSDEIAALSRSITGAARLIEEQRERFALALDVGRINVWTVDAGGRMTVHGSRAGEYGDTHESALVYFSAADAQLMRDVVSGVLSDGRQREYEIENRYDGRRFAGRAIRWSDTEVLGASIDVTAVRKAETEAREAQARRAAAALAASERRGRQNEAIVGSTAEGLIAIDQRGSCTSVNPAAARMLGYHPSELLGRSLHATIHHSHPDGTEYPEADCLMLRAVTTGRSERVEHEVFWRRDGSRLPVEYSVAPMTHQAGHASGGVVTFVDASGRRDTSDQLERAAAELRRAVINDDLVLHYQPKIHLPTGAMHTVEALVRWRRGEELLGPDAFIPLAEQTQVIDSVTDWVVQHAAAQAAAWLHEGLDLRIAVNLSGLCLANDRIVQVLASAADRHGLAPSQLEIEVTETAVATDPESAVNVLGQLGRLGIQRALDDFGTGYSSLAYLKHLPVDELKIDKTFVMNMPHDTRDQAIVAATVHMARSLGMTTTVEGVETPLVLEMVRRAECDNAQGYHWSKPLPPASLATWARRQRGEAARAPAPRSVVRRQARSR